MKLRVATYNVRGFRPGLSLLAGPPDPRPDPKPATAVLCELNADIVALQEVACAPRAGETCDPAATLQSLADATGHTPLTGLNLTSLRSPCCNALLVREEAARILDVQAHDVSRPDREPREAVVALLEAEGVRFRAVAVHLGLGLVERPSQLAQLAGLCKGWGGPTLLLGDFNEWNPYSRTARRLREELGAPPAGATFPVGWWVLPLLPLDRLGALGGLQLHGVAPHRSDAAQTASDHLPLQGILTDDTT